MKCHDGQKASFSSFQQIYFGHVKALPYSTALVCFCDSLYRTSESLRVRLSVVCYAGAFTTSSLCAWYQRAASGCATQELVEWKGLPWNNRPTHCLLLLEGEKRQQLSVTAHLRFFLCLVLLFVVFVTSPPCYDWSFPEHGGESVQFLSDRRQKTVQPVSLIILVHIQECHFR